MSYKRGLAIVFGCAIAALVSFAATYPRFYPQPSDAPAAPDVSVPKAPAAGPVVDFPVLPPVHPNPLDWARLTDAQRLALAPLATVWNGFSEERRRKWLRIAARYPRLSPDAQKRLHQRMAQWVHMTPEQRRVARENYQVSKALPRDARRRAWKAYQQLSPEQKARLAATERKRRPTVVSAPPSGKSEVKDIERLVDARNQRARAASDVAAGALAAPVPLHPAPTASPPATAPAQRAPAEMAPIYQGS